MKETNIKLYRRRFTLPTLWQLQVKILPQSGHRNLCENKFPIASIHQSPSYPRHMQWTIYQPTRNNRKEMTMKHKHMYEEVISPHSGTGSSVWTKNCFTVWKRGFRMLALLWEKFRFQWIVVWASNKVKEQAKWNPFALARLVTFFIKHLFFEIMPIFYS